MAGTLDETFKQVHDKQKYFQSVKKFIHLKTPGDRLTSVIIPAAFVVVGGALMARGVYNMASGTGKLA